MNYMGNVDYMISKLRGTAGSSPGAAAAMKNSGGNSRKVALRYPILGVVVGRILAQVVILAFVVFCAMSIALRRRGGQGPAGDDLLGVFVCWVVACYAVMYCLAWNGRPWGSVLVVAISRPQGSSTRSTTCPRSWMNMARFPMLLVIRLPVRSVEPQMPFGRCIAVCTIAARVRMLTMTMTIMAVSRSLDGEKYVRPVSVRNLR